MKKIVPIVLIVLILAIIGVKFYQYKNPQKFEEITNSITTDKVKKDSTTSTSSLTSYKADIEVQTPVGGTLYGVIEVGASGFNSFVINADKDDNYEVIYKEFGESLAYEGFMTKEDVVTGLKKYLSTIFSKGVNGRNVHFVMSSGALKNPKTKLISQSIKDMGYVVNEVTAEQEGKYALRALLPKNYRDNSFTVDIGSGNTKVSWYEGDKLKTIETFGSKYYQDGVSDTEVSQVLSDVLKQVPNKVRENMFIIGGVPFKLAKETSNESRFIKLKKPSEYTANDDAKLRSGLVIYDNIYEELKPNQVVFDWDTNFTIGFLLTLN